MTRLTTKIVEKPWGKDALPPQFHAPHGKRIGEVWFEPPPEMPDLLVKYIFTSEKLSVQVHPSDAQAVELGENDRGKEECWLVIDAEPGATLGIGFKEHVDTDTMRAAALDGSIERLMEWFPVKAGDFFYIPAGTVHAIGAGVSLIEIQQNSDITYRLYDYGRPRELHLDKGLAVAKGVAHDPALRLHVSGAQALELINGRYFSAMLMDAASTPLVDAKYQGACLVIPLQHGVHVRDLALQPGDCGLAQSCSDLCIDALGSCIVVTPA